LRLKTPCGERAGASAVIKIFRRFESGS